MLALPKNPVEKYQPPPPETFKTFGPVEDGIAFRCDHLSRPFIRMLYENRRLYKAKDPVYEKKITKVLDKSWDAIYNYYRKILRNRRLKRLKRKREKELAKKPKGKALEKIEQERKERLGILSTPKKVFLPEKIPRKWKALEELLRDIDRLALPKEYHIIPPREVGVVSKAALEYEITEAIMKLYTIPERMKGRQSDPCLGYVKKSALRATCSPRVEKLAQPSFSAREAKKHDEDKYDPWVISKNALKYKPSARILELAKPFERE
ncbi:THEG domain containing protein [Asbolus verrucosus]|uniref:THEG domain containing protein n=1 Tax=Asbolus verrucosus TaxID=1661398 RepID=A0A482WEH9_ASBVE|nr:THEG domain containing protein [Asbolus verrucosus]